MRAATAQSPEPAQITACTVSRDVQEFDLLIEDMEREFGEGWGDLGFEDAVRFFDQPDASGLEFVALALDAADEGAIEAIAGVVRAAEGHGLNVIVIAQDVSPATLHRILRLGAREFLPYPLPQDALHEAVEAIRRAEAEARRAADAAPAEMTSKLTPTGDRDALVLPVHGLGGGTGASTFAVNLAWELATIGAEAPRVCLLDLDLQFGSVATYLDLPQREAVIELLGDIEAADEESFLQALLVHGERLHVLTAPPELVPLDLIGPDEVARLLQFARRNFDFVVVDMPSSVVLWTETVLAASHVYFAMIELDMRTAQNALRLTRILRSEDLGCEKLRYVLNRAPKFADLGGRSRVKKLAESLDIGIEVRLPDGAREVGEACDRGLPLAATAKKNALRKEIRKLAEGIHATRAGAAAGG